MTLRESKRLQVRGDILRVCEAAFRARGFEATSIDEIAAAAAISRQTFFNYFAGKDAVMTELAVEWLKRQADLPRLAAGGAKTSVLAAARRYVSQQARAIQADRKFMKLVILHAAPVAPAGGSNVGRNGDLGRSIFQGVAEILRAGQVSGEIRGGLEPARMAEVYVSAMLMSVRMWLLEDDKGSLETRLNAAIDILEGGLKAPRTT